MTLATLFRSLGWIAVNYPGRSLLLVGLVSALTALIYRWSV